MMEDVNNAGNNSDRRTYYFIKKPNNAQLIEGVLNPKPGRKQVVATQDVNIFFWG